MTTINELSLLSSVSSGDQIAVYSPTQGDTRRTSIGSLATYLQQSGSSTPTDVYYELYYPVTGFNKELSEIKNTWLYLHPTTTLATGTITMPLYTLAPDGMEVTIFTTQEITSFTLNGNGASNLFGEPVVLSAESWVKMKYFTDTLSWYRVA